ncbi:MAG: efflux RND transporter periplasmic adaptor subunit [Gemmataceae bacterium]|nr:efflux RND transporter periplasmic adaptor subunit [Gemmataceae bacterium]MDW8265543.1 efflux RND transporter periplasmic adaptor subunit [Gemmataceae bacterium]
MNESVPQTLVRAAELAGRNGQGSLSDRVRSLRLEERAERPGPSRRTWLPWFLCAVMAAIAAIQSLRTPSPAESEPARVEATANVSTAATAPQATVGEVVLESKGYIVPTHQVQVSPRVSGMVERLYIEEGKRVQRGDILAELEKVDYQADVDRAKAALAAARQRLNELVRNHPDEINQVKAELEEAEAQREQLYLEWKRNVNLRTGNALAAREYEQAYSAYKAMDRRVERLRLALKLVAEGPRLDRIAAAKAEVEQAEAELVKAQWRLDNCTVRAPLTGTILTKKAEEGNIVNPIAFNVSASLCDMADLSDLEVDLTIQERDIAKVFKGQRCRVRAEAFPERTYEGVVSRLMPIADRAKGAIPVRVKVTVPREEEGVYLKPEMGAVVSFLRRE